MHRKKKTERNLKPVKQYFVEISSPSQNILFYVFYLFTVVVEHLLVVVYI